MARCIISSPYGRILRGSLLTPSPIWVTISLLEATKVTDLQKIAQSALEALEAKNAVRERVLPLARQLVRHSANTIRAVHRGELAEAKKMLVEGRNLVQELKANLSGHPDLYHSGYTQDALRSSRRPISPTSSSPGRNCPAPRNWGWSTRPILKGWGKR